MTSSEFNTKEDKQRHQVTLNYYLPKDLQNTGFNVISEGEIAYECTCARERHGR